MAPFSCVIFFRLSMQYMETFFFYITWIGYLFHKEGEKTIFFLKVCLSFESCSFLLDKRAYLDKLLITLWYGIRKEKSLDYELLVLAISDNESTIQSFFWLVCLLNFNQLQSIYVIYKISVGAPDSIWLASKNLWCNSYGWKIILRNSEVYGGNRGLRFFWTCFNWTIFLIRISYSGFSLVVPSLFTSCTNSQL